MSRLVTHGCELRPVAAPAYGGQELTAVISGDLHRLLNRSRHNERITAGITTLTHFVNDIIAFAPFALPRAPWNGVNWYVPFAAKKFIVCSRLRALISERQNKRRNAWTH
jgi:hypothetical protein